MDKLGDIPKKEVFQHKTEIRKTVVSKAYLQMCRHTKQHWQGPKCN